MRATTVKSILLACCCVATTGFAQDSQHQQVNRLLEDFRPDGSAVRIELAGLGKDLLQRYGQTGRDADLAAAVAAYHYACIGPLSGEPALQEAAMALGGIFETGTPVVPADTLAAISCYARGDAKSQGRASALRDILAARSGFSAWPERPLAVDAVTATLLGGHPVFWQNDLPAVDPSHATMAFRNLVDRLAASPRMADLTLVIHTPDNHRNRWNPFATMDEHVLEGTLTGWHDAVGGRIRLLVQPMPAAFGGVAQAKMVLRLVAHTQDATSPPRQFRYQEGLCGSVFAFFGNDTYAAELGCEGRSTQSVGYVRATNDTTLALYQLPHPMTSQMLDWDGSDIRKPATLHVVDRDGQPARAIRVALVVDTNRLDAATVHELPETGILTLPPDMAYGYAAILARGEEPQQHRAAFVALGPVKGKRFTWRLQPGWLYRNAGETQYLHRPDSTVLTVLGTGRRLLDGQTILAEVGGDPLGYPDLAQLDVDALIGQANAAFAAYSQEPAQFRRNAAANTIELRFQTPEWLEFPGQPVLQDADRRLRYEPYYESAYVMRIAVADGYPLYNIFVDRAIGLKGIDRLRSVVLAIALKQQGHH